MSKVKSSAKIAIPHSEALQQKVLATLKRTAQIVGGTLGPHGRPVLLERPEVGLKVFMTKDGVTVAKNLGYKDPIEHAVLEAALDSTTRTAQDAGDGTTSATILAYSIAKEAYEATKNNKKVPSQRLVRAINALVPLVEDIVKEHALKVTSDNYDTLLRKVATLSANGDTEIADVIMESYDIVGFEGNITVTEAYGNGGYEVERINGLTVDKGYEESCENYYGIFLNDESRSNIKATKPIYWLFDGLVNDFSTLQYPLSMIDAMNTSGETKIESIVVFAHGFSKQLLGQLAYNFSQPGTLKIIPALTSQTAFLNSRTQFLHDVAAFTGAKVFNPLANPIQQAEPADLICGTSEEFEAGRYKSLIKGEPNADAIMFRVDELKHLKDRSESILDKQELERRIAKLTCGIAKVKVMAPSQIEIRERKDRAEDAWCAIKSAAKHGALPGGGWTLIKISGRLAEMSVTEKDPAKQLAMDVLSKALLAPVEILYSNAGYSPEETVNIVNQLSESDRNTFDIQQDKWVPIHDLLDSAPAVTEAIRNSISTATLLGTLGGVVVFNRDEALERSNAKDNIDYQKALYDGESTATAVYNEDVSGDA